MEKMIENAPFALLGVSLATSFLLIDFITCSMTPEPHVPEDLSFCLLCVFRGLCICQCLFIGES